MSNYNDINFILDLEIDDFIGLREKLAEKEEKELEDKRDEFLLHRWGYELGHMEKVIQFEEYRDIAIGKKGNKRAKSNVDKISNEELIERINKIKDLDQKASKSEVINYETL